MSLSSRRRAVLVFLAFAFGYFFSALLRGVTATLAPALTGEFGLDAGDLGLLAGGYFLGFAAVQLPLGTWLDRHGPRAVILGFLLVAVLGCIAFGLAGSFAGLLAARVLCGVGVSACLMAPLTAFRRWYEPGVQLRANSWILMTGSLGMLASTLPVQWLVPITGWRPLFFGLAACLVVAMLLIAWQVPDWSVIPSKGRPPSYAAVWRNAYFQRMAPLGFFSYGGMIAVQALWAGPWLVRVVGDSPLRAAAGLFTMNVSMLAAFWCWGIVNPWLQRRGLHTNRLIAWGWPAHFVVLCALVVLGPDGGAGWLAAFCVTCTVVALAQPAVGMAFPDALAGRALSGYNLVIFVGVFVIQWGIGLLVDAFRGAGWSEVDAFRGAFAVHGATSLASYGWFLAAANRDNRREAS